MEEMRYAPVVVGKSIRNAVEDKRQGRGQAMLEFVGSFEEGISE